MSAVQFVGVCGFVVYILSFLLLQTRHLDGHGVAYPAMNVAAAGMVLVSLTEAFNLASALIQISFILIGTHGITLRLWQSGALTIRKNRPQ